MQSERNHLIAFILAILTPWLAPLCARAAEGSPLPENPYALDVDRTCGPLCLSFLDTFFRGENRFDEILKICPPGNFGTNLEQIRRAAEDLGYQTVAFKNVTTDQLRRMRYPAIVHLERSGGGGGHYVVLLDWDRKTGDFRGFDPPNQFGSLKADWVAGHMSGLGLIVSNTTLTPATELLDNGVDWHHWLGTGILFGVCVCLLIVDRRRLRQNTRGVRLPVPGLGTTALLLFVTTTCMSCAKPVTPGSASGSEGGTPASQFVNLGTVQAGTVLKHTFQVVNTSKSPFRIKDLEKSCTCQTVGVEMDREIRPGESTSISLQAPTKTAEGPFSQRVLVKTDSPDPDLAAIELILRATVEARIKVIPSQIMLGNVEAGKGTQATLRVKFDDPKITDRLTSAELTENPYVTLKRREGTLGEAKYVVEVDEKMPAGAIYGEVRFKFNDPDFPQISVPISGLKLGNLKVLPQAIVLDHGVTLPESRLLRVFSTDRSAFEVTRVQAPQGVDVSWDKAEGSAPSISLRVKVGEKISSGPLSLVVHAEHKGDRAEVRVPIFVQGAAARN